MKKIIVILLCIFIWFSALLSQSRTLTKTALVPVAMIPDSEASHVLVLATTHLKSYGEDFNHDVLKGLLDALARYHPDLIAIESAAPLFVRDMFNSGGSNIDILKRIGGFRASEFGKSVRTALDINWLEAKNSAKELLGRIKTVNQDSRITDLRRKLITNFLAMDDMYSALLQWSYLPEKLRTDFYELDKEILDYFTEHIKSPNENVSIGITLAQRLNHQRLYAINDHRDKEDFFKVSDSFSKAFEENKYLKTQPWKPLLDELTDRQNKAYKAGNLLPFYQWINSEEFMQKDLNTQWKIMIDAKLPEGMGHIRVAFWDVRNFGIASNIRRAMAMYPGEKMLVIIGGSHKIFLDALLAECMEVKVVQLKDFVSK